MFTRLAHVCLHVRSLRTSLDFYSKLGFRPVFRFTRDGALYGAYMEIAPGSYVEFFEDPSASATPQGGLRHFCLETDGMEGVVAALDAQGIAHTAPKKGCDDTWQIWLRDPDGNDFEVHAYTETSRQKTGGDVEADW